MGHQVSTMLNGFSRFFEYPVKRKPICFYRQEDFTATDFPPGHPQVRKSVAKHVYQQLSLRDSSHSRPSVLTIFDRIITYQQEMKEKDRRWSMQKVVERFPGWNEVTIANLHSLFLLFDNQSNGMLGFDDFSAVLESLGDESSMDYRKENFHNTDTDNDGWITYDEFLSLVYNFHPQFEGQLTGLALLCNQVADNIQFVTNLTVGEQLEYGLF